MRTVAIVNQKGGCGKTTTAISLAGVYASQGLRVLLVDMDPQSHCAAGLGIPEKRIDLDITDALHAADGHGIDPAKLIWKPSRNLDLIPSRMKLAGLEAARGGLADRPDRQLRLAMMLAKLQDSYDLCLIDCSPAIGLLTYNALAASNAALIPVETSFFSLQGASRQVATVKSLARQLDLTIRTYMVATIHDTASGLAGDLLEELRKRFDEAVCPFPIRQDPRLKEAASMGKHIVQYAPDSTGAEDYAMVAAWLKQRIATRSGEPVLLDDAPDPAATGETDGEEGLVRFGSIQTAALAQKLAGRAPHAGEQDPPGRASTLITEPPPAAEATPGIAEQIASDLRTRSATRAEEMARLAQKLSGRGPSAPAHATPVALASVTATPAADPPPAPSPPAQQPATAHTPLTLIEELKPPATLPAIGMPLGVRQTRQGMLFIQPLAMASTIAIAADFNAWSSDRHTMKRNNELGVFELCVPLPPGRYSYRLVVDGRWQCDPFNPATEPNPFGEPNSVLSVAGASGGVG